MRYFCNITVVLYTMWRDDAEHHVSEVHDC